MEKRAKPCVWQEPAKFVPAKHLCTSLEEALLDWPQSYSPLFTQRCRTPYTWEEGPNTEHQDHRPGGRQLHAEPESQKHEQGVMQQQLHSAQCDLWLFSQTKGHVWGEGWGFPRLWKKSENRKIIIWKQKPYPCQAVNGWASMYWVQKSPEGGIWSRGEECQLCAPIHANAMKA